MGDCHRDFCLGQGLSNSSKGIGLQVIIDSSGKFHDHINFHQTPSLLSSVWPLMGVSVLAVLIRVGSRPRWTGKSADKTSPWESGGVQNAWNDNGALPKALCVHRYARGIFLQPPVLFRSCCIPTASTVPTGISLPCRFRRITQRLWGSQY